MSQSPFLLPLSLLVLTSSLNVGSVKAQTLKKSEVEGRLAERTTAAHHQAVSISEGLTTLGASTGKGSAQTGQGLLQEEKLSASQLEGDFPSHQLSSSNSALDITQVPNPITQPSQLPPELPSSDIPLNLPRDRQEPPSQAPLEAPAPAPLPPPEQLLESPPSSPRTPEPVPGRVPETITIQRFEFEGNTVFSDQELAKVTAPFTNRAISFAELFQARSAVTQLYLDKGYITSGALIPPQALEGGVVKIQVVEGGLEGINVTGTRRLNPNYVRSRIAIATKKPLNRERLLEALQLLQLNPLIQNLSAELSAGTRPGLSLLEVKVSEAKTFGVEISADNNRSPSVGSFRRRVQINEANLLGLGDGISVSYNNTDGSNGVDFSYTLPINPRNGTFRFSYGFTDSDVIEAPFNELDINSTSRYYEFSLRQPIVQTPTQEFALGLVATRQESKATFIEGLPFPAPGTDEQGRTRVSALRFFQEWTKRNSREVIAARSQFSLGIGAFDATINPDPPDSRFFSWRGQAQWVRLLAADTLFLIRSDVQLADRALVPLEQFGIGGQQSVRGYRQDLLLTDNGALVSAEVRIPILRLPKQNALLQVAPFVDFGAGWNHAERADPDPNVLVSTGIGLQLQLSDRLTIRLDYGIPLVSVDSSKRTWQENGFYFSIVGSPF